MIMMAQNSPFLQLLLLWFVSVSAKTFYATPTCPEGNMSCMTLSQYAVKPSDYFASKTTLILLPGNHSLDSEFEITKLNSFSLSSASVDETAETVTVTVTCSQPAARLTFEGIGHVQISGTIFVGCMNNTITSVKQFILRDCAFYGQDCKGTGVNLETVSNAVIFKCTFSSNTGRVYDSAWNMIVKGGGAIIVKNSKVNMTHCLFNGNTVNSTTIYSIGGAVLALNSIIIIDYCEFSDNKAVGKASCAGGAVYIGNSTFVVHNSTFSNNAVCNGDSGGGAVFVLGSNITMHNSTLINNIANGRGIGGALCIQGSVRNIAKLHRSTFINNSANTGGGISIQSLLPDLIEVLMKDTTFSHNSAHSLGATLYIFKCNLLSTGYLNMYSNTANYSIVYVSQSTMHLSGITHVSSNIGSVFAFNSNITLSGNTSFMNNSCPNMHSSLFVIQEGGALTFFQGNLYLLDTVNILNNNAKNGGGILATESKVYVYGNITVTNNRALQSGGGIYAYQTELNIQGSVIVTGNKADKQGGGIHAINSIIKVLNGPLYLIENDAERSGGGICLELNAKLYIMKTECESYSGDECTNSNPSTWPRIIFIDNSADYGGAVYIADDTNSAGTCSATSFKEQSATSDCFFQVLSLYTRGYSTQLNLINLNFTNNTARVAGGALFGGLIDRCTINPFAEILQKSHNSINASSYLLKVTNIRLERNNSLSEISSYPVRVCLCVNDQPDCNSHQPLTKYVQKGSFFTVPVVAVDQVNNTVPNSTIHSSLLSGQGRLGEGQAIQVTNSDESCTELNYTVFSPHNGELMLLLYAEGPCNNTGISANHISIVFLQCPIGFKPANNTREGDCSCDPALSPYITVNCFINNQTVLREGDFWISYFNSSNENDIYSGFIAKPHCPFDYCHPATEMVYINFTIPSGSDAQCAFNRKGILCGSCGENLSLSLGTSRCKSCSNNWLALLILFAIAGIALVAFIMVFNLTVAVGTINELIFYANIIAANHTIFFPFDKPNLFTVFIAWLNLDFGFETCFYDGMDGYAKVWLQLAFPCYIILLVAMVIVVCEYSKRFSKLLSYTNPVATLATLILLSYAKLLRTIIAALSFTTIQYPDGSVEAVWLYDANVPYLKGKHIALFTVAVFILLVGLVYTLLLMFWQFLKVSNLMRNGHNNMTLHSLYRLYNTRVHRYIYSFMDVYHAPYNPSHRYWTGLLLLLRGVLYLTSAVNVFGDPNVNLLSIICVVILLLVWKLIVTHGIYKTEYLNNLNTLLLANIGVFAAGTSYVRATGGGNQAALAYTSTSVPFVFFLGILCYHMKRIPQYFCVLVKGKIGQHHHDHHDHDHLIVHTKPEIRTIEDSRKPLSSSSLDCSQTEIDGLPDRDQGETEGKIN